MREVTWRQWRDGGLPNLELQGVDTKSNAVKAPGMRPRPHRPAQQPAFLTADLEAATDEAPRTQAAGEGDEGPMYGEDYLTHGIYAMDPKQGIEHEYWPTGNPLYVWRGARLLWNEVGMSKLDPQVWPTRRTDFEGLLKKHGEAAEAEKPERGVEDGSPSPAPGKDEDAKKEKEASNSPEKKQSAGSVSPAPPQSKEA
eukprot:Hpha_TRINITY_DN10819_c0_g1::TRINITY_DN10819_c0_g1_i2::g.23467::m.23467